MSEVYDAVDTPGSWSVNLRPSTPLHVVNELNEFDWLFVTPRIDSPAPSWSALVERAWYAGICLEPELTTGGHRLAGAGLGWLVDAGGGVGTPTASNGDFYGVVADLEAGGVGNGLTITSTETEPMGSNWAAPGSRLTEVYDFRDNPPSGVQALVWWGKRRYGVTLEWRARPGRIEIARVVGRHGTPGANWWENYKVIAVDHRRLPTASVTPDGLVAMPAELSYRRNATRYVDEAGTWSQGSPAGTYRQTTKPAASRPHRFGSTSLRTRLVHWDGENPGEGTTLEALGRSQASSAEMAVTSEMQMTVWGRDDLPALIGPGDPILVWGPEVRMAGPSMIRGPGSEGIMPLQTRAMGLRYGLRQETMDVWWWPHGGTTPVRLSPWVEWASDNRSTVELGSTHGPLLQTTGRRR